MYCREKTGIFSGVLQMTISQNELSVLKNPFSTERYQPHICPDNNCLNKDVAEH